MPTPDDNPRLVLAQSSHRLITHRQAHAALHGSGRIGRVNRWLAIHITQSVGSMWCAYAFTALALVSLPAALRSGDPVVVVSWISQTFLQLVLLSIIIVGQRVQSEASDQRAETDHEILMALHAMQITQTEILKRLDAVPAPPAV